MSDRSARLRDERAVSVAVTHVLTVGISTLLISGLLLGTAGMLDTQKERAGQQELAAIGDRHASEIVTAVDRGQRYESNVTIRSKQPDHAIGGSYTVNLTDSSECRVRSGYDGCITVTSAEGGHSVEVPLSLPGDITHIDSNTVQGGRVVVVYEHNVFFGTSRVTIRGEES